MRRVPKGLVRLGRLGLPAVAVLGLTLAGCGDPAAPTPGAPSPSAPSSSPSSPATTSVTPSAGTAGGDGLTVRYLADDGTVKTVGVEDFPR